MTPAGYSGTPLARKLGIKPGATVGIIDPPPGFDETLGELPDDVNTHQSMDRSDIFIVFGQWADELEALFGRAASQLPSNGAIWVAWPKKSSGVETDITEDTLRDLFLPTGMVDNKVCAIDGTWSGLRFVVRTENRAGWRGG
jgi:hypothetical protein